MCAMDNYEHIIIMKVCCNNVEVKKTSLRTLGSIDTEVTVLHCNDFFLTILS